MEKKPKVDSTLLSVFTLFSHIVLIRNEHMVEARPSVAKPSILDLLSHQTKKIISYMHAPWLTIQRNLGSRKS